jgi:hypothetical protein
LVQRGRCCRETTIRNCFALCDDWKYTARTCTHIIACMITLRVCLRRLNLHGKEMCFSGIRSTDWRSTVNLIHLIQWLTKAALIQTRFFCPINWVAPIKLCTTTAIQWYPIDSCHVTSKQFLPTPCRPFPWNYPHASTYGWRGECSRAWKDTDTNSGTTNYCCWSITQVRRYLEQWSRVNPGRWFHTTVVVWCMHE